MSKLIFKDIVKFREVLLTALSPTPHINHSSQAWCSHAVTAHGTHDVGPRAGQVRHVEVGEEAQGRGPSSAEPSAGLSSAGGENLKIKCTLNLKCSE